MPRFEIGTFLAGVVAGSMVDHIGVIGAFDFPILTSELEGFVLGARYVNPEIEVSRVFVNTFVDPAEGRAAAEAQIAAGARIIFTGLSDAIQGVYLAAREQGETYVVAQYFDSFEQAPDVVLTSVIYNLQGVAKKLIELAATGELANQHYSFGLADLDVGRLAPFHDLEAIVPQEAKDNLADATALIESGDLVVPNPGVLGTSGSGSDVDPQSLVQG